MESEKRIAQLEEKRKQLQDLRRKKEIVPEIRISPVIGRSDKGVQTSEPFNASPSETTATTSAEFSYSDCSASDSAEFNAFLRRASRYVEEAIADPRLFTEVPEKNYGTGALIEQRTLEHSWTTGRPVNCIDWSPHHPELLLGCYQSDGNDAGAVAVWDVRLHSSPLRSLAICVEVASTARWLVASPSLMAVGMHSGAIALCDIRSARGLVHECGVSAASHTFRIVEVFEDSGGAGFSSVSSDGLVCDWDIRRLAQPRSHFRLHSDISATSASMITCASRSTFSSALCYFGFEDGSFFVQDRGLKKYTGHASVVTDVAASRNSDVELFATASLDCFKIWSGRTDAAVAPLLQVDAGAAITSMDWSPLPTVFATADCCGNLRLFDLLRDVDDPVATSSPTGRGLTTVQFDASGRQIAIGDVLGSVVVVRVSDELSVSRVDGGSRLRSLLQSRRLV